MIVKNEEKYLEGCLASVKDVVDEIVIVDTGSTDSTLEIASKYNSNIYKFDWINDFSAARNFALSKSTGDWILYLDADERLAENSVDELKKIISSKDNAGYKCSVNSINNISGISNKMKYIRLFANNSQLYFTGKAHEQIEKSLLELNYEIKDSDIKIIHLGYNVEQSELNKKAERNLKLLIEDFKTNPSAYNAFQIGQTFVMLNKIEDSVEYFNYAIKNNSLNNVHKSHCYRYLAAYELNKNNDLAKALELAEIGLRLNSKQIILHVILSSIHLRLQNYDKAEEHCRLSYKFNIEQKNKANDFEILLNDNDVLNHGLDIAIMSSNKKLFNDFYDKLNKKECEEKRNKLLEIFNTLLNNKVIVYERAAHYAEFINDEFVPYALLLLDPNYDSKTKIVFYENFIARKNYDYRLLNLLAISYGEVGDKNNSIKYFEESLQKINNNPNTILNLVSLYAGTGQYVKLNGLIDNSVSYFESQPQIKNKLLSLKKKIESLV
ncbi:MAG: glycosyltransferase family 2 protein [Ignavibacteria bacterium]